jgi:hypothetical protein
VENVLAKGNLKCVIICLYPILTESDEKRTSRMVPHEYWGTLGSINTLDLYRRKLLVRYGKMYDYYNDYGWYNFNLRKEGDDSLKLTRDKSVEIDPDKPIIVNERAYKDLDELLKAIRAKGIKIFAYFHPIPQGCFRLYERSYRSYQAKINTLFVPTDVVWDYNTEEFLEFRNDYKNYCDEIHLSLKGVAAITRHINTKIAPQARSIRPADGNWPPLDG